MAKVVRKECGEMFLPGTSASGSFDEPVDVADRDRFCQLAEPVVLDRMEDVRTVASTIVPGIPERGSVGGGPNPTG